MKRVFVVMACAVVLSGCSMFKRTPVAAVQAPVTVAEPELVDANGVAIERVPFRAGVSSVTVENMAKAQGCTGSVGAGLMTPQGPVEVYRIMCDNGKVFMAKCELRQCSPMPGQPYGGNGTGVAPNGGVAGAPVRGVLGRKEVPKLAVNWGCGACEQNDRMPALLAEYYASAAAARGYTVSGTETAQLTITAYRQRNPAVRVLFGIMAGKDILATKTAYKGQRVAADDYSANAWVGMNGVSDTVAKRVFEQLRQD